ncbi:hypothetical protein M1N57_01615 [Dehalococcoidales bacterium]|nr:hypothetical protein [Dehalococcoidales bacterium]
MRFYNRNQRRYVWLPRREDIVVKLPSYGEVMEEVKAELLRLVGEKVVEFQEEFVHWFGKPWQRDRDAKGIILCPQCAESPGFERREEAKMLLPSVW